MYEKYKCYKYVRYILYIRYIKYKNYIKFIKYTGCLKNWVLAFQCTDLFRGPKWLAEELIKYCLIPNLGMPHWYNAILTHKGHESGFERYEVDAPNKSVCYCFYTSLPQCIAMALCRMSSGTLGLLCGQNRPIWTLENAQMPYEWVKNMI